MSTAAIAYFIAAPALMLSVLFLIFMFFALIRLKLVISATNLCLISILFYLFIAIETTLRTALYLYITVTTYLSSISTTPTDNPMKDKVFITFEYLPDILFWLIFTLLLFQLLDLFYSAHSNDNNIQSLNFLTSETSRKKRFFIVLFVGWTLYLISQSILIILFQTDCLSLERYSELISMFHLLLPLILALIELYLHVIFSGRPYISLLASHKKSIVNKVIVVWAIGRVLHAIWAVYLAFYEPNLFIKVMSEDELDNDTYLELILLITFELIDKIINELLAFLFVFDLEFVNIFSLASIKRRTSIGFESLMYQNKNTTINLLNSNENLLPLSPLDIQTIENEDLYPLNKRNGFGVLELCYIKPDNSKQYILRRLNLKGFTNYLAEEFLSDLPKYQEIQMSSTLRLNKVYSYSITEFNSTKSLCLISEYYNNGSLARLLKTKKQISFEIKAKIAIEICNVFIKLHSFDPPLVHGHLTTNNILLDEEFRPIISDYGFFSLKKFYMVLHSYNQKTIYTAPEALKGNNYKRDKGLDIYSFGIILYELFVEKIINETYSGKRLVQLVCDEKNRPKIGNLDSKLANLIRCCWQEEQEKRPSFEKIEEILKKVFKN